MSMNIGIVCDSVNLQNAGSLVSTWRFAVALAKRNDVILISSGESDSVKVEEGVKVIRFSSSKTFGTQGSWRIPFFTSKKKIKDILVKEKIEVLHYMIPTILCYKAMKVARELGIPVIAHSHTQPENVLMMINMDYKFLNYVFYKYLIWFYKKADVLICPTVFAERLIKRYDSLIKTKIVSNGVDLSKFKRKKTSGKYYKKFKLDKGDKRIVYVGRLWPEKNISTLIKAVQKIIERDKKIHLDIVGKKEREYPSLRKLVSELNLEDNISFLGRVEDNDLINAYNSCDLFCLPSLIELEGMVVLEAMGFGKPILVSDSEDSASKYFVKGNGYTFQASNHEDLAKKALKILENEELKKKMGKKSLEIVKELDLDKCARNLEKIYRIEIKKS